MTAPAPPARSEDRQPPAAASAPPQGPTDAHAPWVLRVVTIGTVAFLAVQLSAGLLLRNGTWPVPGFPMFRNERSFALDPQLVVTTEDGDVFVAGPNDLGLTRHQMVAYVTSQVADRDGEPKAGAQERVGEMVRAWERWNDRDAVTGVLRYRHLPHDPREEATAVDVVEWSP